MSIADLLTHSPTVATLNARGELRRLRMLIAGPVRGDAAGSINEALAELDRLEDVIGDLCDVGRLVESGDFVTRKDLDENYVSNGTYSDAEDEKRDAEEERDRENERADQAEEERDEALSALEDDADEVRNNLGEALRKNAALSADLRALEEKLARAEKRCEALKSPAAPRVHVALYSQSFELTREQRRSAHAVAVHDRYVAGIKAMRTAVEAAVKGETS